MRNNIAVQEKSTELLTIRVKPSEKASYRKAAGGSRRVSKWAKQILSKFIPAK